MSRLAVGLLVVEPLLWPGTKGQRNFHIRHLRGVSKDQEGKIVGNLTGCIGVSSTCTSTGLCLRVLCLGLILLGVASITIVVMRRTATAASTSTTSVLLGL